MMMYKIVDISDDDEWRAVERDGKNKGVWVFVSFFLPLQKDSTSQAHLVSLNPWTILTGQGHISKVPVNSEVF